MPLTFVAPIYWTYQTKAKSTTHLIGMNFFRNAHYHVQNKLKHDIEELLHNQPKPSSSVPLATFTVQYKLYYKNPSCDPSNVIALIEKFFLDFAQDANLIQQDSINHHLGSSWTIAGQDKLHPRCEITLSEA